MTTHSPLDTYCGTLREALTHLIEAVEYAAGMPDHPDLATRYWYSPRWALDAAKEVLAMDQTGVQAQHEAALTANIALLAYTFADALAEIVLGHPRHPNARRPTTEELVAGLAELERLTHAGYERDMHA